jgi:hypothetical protein
MPDPFKMHTQPPIPSAEELKALSVAALARIIRKDWKKPYFGAVPYIEAMHAFEKDGDRYGVENAQGICTYFLANAGTWRGDTARVVKAELKRRFKLK